MADALIKYETIDREQIKDIMAGKEPRPPEDWTDSGPTSGEAESGEDKKDKSPGKIGGPASQH
jgi:cell division protease FtsH